MSYWRPIFDSMFDSSVWDEPYHVRLLWVAMIGLQGRDHVVRCTPYALHKRANITEEEALEGLRVLSNPDRRRKEHQEFEGRRIREVEGGWLVLNGAKYYELMQKVRRQEGQNEWAKEDRKKKKLLSARERITRAVENDPLIKEGKAIMRKKWGVKSPKKAPTTAAAEYDLDDAGDHAEGPEGGIVGIGGNHETEAPEA